MQGAEGVQSGESIPSPTAHDPAAMQEEAQLRLVLDNLFAFVGLMSPDGTLLEANRAPLEAAGIARDDVVGRKFWDCYWWSYSSKIQDQLRDAIERARRGEVVRYDVPVRMANDSRMWIDFQIAPLRDRGGRITHLIPSAMDLTARRSAEHALRESEERFRATFENAAVGIAHVRLDGRWVRMNDRLCEITGYSREELLERTFQEITHPDDLEADLSQAGRLLAGEIDRYAIEKRYLRPDGTVVWVQVTASLVRAANGTPDYFIAVIEDISGRRQAEEALREHELALREAYEHEQAARAEAESANRAKDDFLAMLGHELRNPLAPIRTAVDLLIRRERSPQLEVIDRQLGHLTRLVDDLLDVARIQEGRIELRRQDIELAACVDGAIETVRPMFEDRRQDLDVDVPSQGLVVHADPARLTQVVVNLLTNASRHSEAGGRISIFALGRGPSVELHVRDEGSGIDPGLLDRVFEPFVQEPQALDRQSGGLGLGLTIARRLVQLHGGTIRAESPGLGAGADFVVDLPLSRGRPPAGGGVRADPRRRERVLVVDDNRDLALLLADVLADLGYEVATAHDGASALETAEAFAPDICLLDIGLPVLDGYEVAERLRATDRGSATPVIIALTGYGQASDRERSRAAGFDVHLVKPVDVETLIRVMRETMAQRDT